MRRRWLAATAILVLASTGCVPAVGGDKAGGPGPPIVLTMANAYDGTADEPMLGYFVERVAQLSNGSLRIRLDNDWGGLAPGAEQQIVTDVAAGRVDLGWVGTHVLDTLGVADFRALNAPMLIDSYALQGAVIASGIPGRMLGGLSATGVTGLAVVGGGLRKPIAVGRPLLNPDDWQGLTVQTLRSNGRASAVRALGATPMDVFDLTSVEDALAAGRIDALERSLWLYHLDALTNHAPYITANVNLWPQTAVVFAGSTAFGRFSQPQQDWLRHAATDTAARSAVNGGTDPDLVREACRSGSRFANASTRDLAAMRQALAPVFADLSADPAARVFLSQIEALKAVTAGEPPLAIPVGCTGTAPMAAGAATGEQLAEVNGVYRWTLNDDDALTYGTAADRQSLDQFPITFTVELRDGAWSMRQTADPDVDRGTYAIAADEITFVWPATRSRLSFRFTLIGNRLELHPIEPMNSGDQFVWATHAWTKVG